jgi:hypothetical protein
MSKAKPKRSSYFNPDQYANNHAIREVDLRHQGELEELEESFERRLSHLRSQSPATAPVIATPSKSPWGGTRTALARKVKADFENRRIPQARTLTAALRWACQEGYELSDGGTLDADSLASLLYKAAKRDEGDPRYF